MKNPLRVHICVVGFEIDRISEAAIKMKADKVYLISQDEGDKGREFLEVNRRLLEEKNIEVIVEFVKSVHDLSALLSKTKKIIIEEDKENYIFINISSGSTVSTIAGTISSMMFDKDRKIIPYYVKPEDYPDNVNTQNMNNLLKKFDVSRPPRSVGIRDIQEIPTFPIKLPNKELIIVLEYIQGSQSEGKQVTKKDLIEFSKDNKYLKEMRENNTQLRELGENSKIRNSNKMDEKSNQKYRDYAWLNQNIISKLKDDWNLINVEKIGKFVRVKLNEKGEKMLSYLNG